MVATLRVVGVAILLVAGTGCVATPEHLKYFEDRALDFADIFGAKFIAGGGGRLGVGIGPTGAPATIGWYNYSKAGFEGRAAGIWHEAGADLIIPLVYEVEARKGNRWIQASVDEHYQIVEESKGVDEYRDFWVGRYHNYGDLQLTAAVCLGVEFNFSPKQLIDFMLGWAYIDICDDDCLHGPACCDEGGEHVHAEQAVAQNGR